LIGASRSDSKFGNRQVVLERIRWNMLLFQFAHHLAAALLNKKKNCSIVSDIREAEQPHP